MKKKESKQEEKKQVVTEDKAVLDLRKKRQKMIDDLKSRLLTNTQLKRGGPGILGRHIAEKGYQAIIDEINVIGKQLGEAPVRMGGLRRA